jgi:hypothetical protein
VEELSHWCGNCGTELRSGAQFCSRCGQRVIGEEPATGSSGVGPGFTEAGSRLAAAAPGSAPGSGSGSGLDALFAAPWVAPEQAPAPPPPQAPPPAAAMPPQENGGDWYADTAPRSPFEPLISRPPAGPPPAQPPPVQRPPAYNPPAYQQPAYNQPAYQQPGYQQPRYQQPAAPAPFYPQPQRSPYEPPPGGPPGPDRRSRAPLFWSALSVAVVAAVVAFLFLVHPFNHHETVNDAANSTGTTAPASAASTSSAAASASATVSASPSASAAASASASASASSTAVTEQQAASTVAGMLASSVADRTAIDNAYNDVDSCGPNLDSDAAVFTRAASSRSALLASLAAMPGRSALPPALLSDLASAWQASISADQGFATWASDEATQGCVADDTSDPGYQATITPDNEATEYKTAFVAQWNPLATSYGLTTYQQNQL